MKDPSDAGARDYRADMFSSEVREASSSSISIIGCGFKEDTPPRLSGVPFVCFYRKLGLFYLSPYIPGLQSVPYFLLISS